MKMHLTLADTISITLIIKKVFLLAQCWMSHQIM